MLLWIRAKQDVPRRRKDLKKLHNSLKLYEDSDGLLRLRGRFQNASFVYGIKHSIILPDDSRRFTPLLVWEAHEKVLHHGMEKTLNFVRNKY